MLLRLNVKNEVKNIKTNPPFYRQWIETKNRRFIPCNAYTIYTFLSYDDAYAEIDAENCRDKVSDQGKAVTTRVFHGQFEAQQSIFISLCCPKVTYGSRDIWRSWLNYRSSVR